ncbi:MAG: hypothetical protein PHU80_06940 [Kiritimatiellae bacterium]|nr:hypothetical protein [Kiritimatiellia bacterium]
MKLPPAGFDNLVCAVLDDKADKGQLTSFRLLMRQHPELLEDYIAQCDVHAALTAISDCPEAFVSSNCRHQMLRQPPCQPCLRAPAARFINFCREHGAATAAALFVTGTVAALWLASLTDLTLEPVSVAAGAPAQVIRQIDVRDLELPDSMPGTLRLRQGQVTLRLNSGVEMTLLGPLEMKIISPMETRLNSGRLVAEVPKPASGFTLHTPDLEMWDIGTVFGASVDENGSVAFVFKGEVQVVEACGEPVDICRTGEGVRAKRGKHAVKIAADWPEAESLLADVNVTEISRSPAQALRNAAMISELWAERYLPEEAWLKSQRIAKMYADSQRIPFTKKAWARPQARVNTTGSNRGWPVKEKTEMTKKSAAGALLAAATLTGAGGTGAFSEPAKIFFAPHLNRHWSVVYTNEVPINWEWPAGAATAELSISGMNSSFNTNFSPDTSGYLWRTFDSAVPQTEDVYSLTLSFRDGTSTVIETKTATLAMLKGSFGSATINPGPDNRKWSKVSDNAVIPYDAEWDPATYGAVDSQIVIAKVGGSTQTNTLSDAAGYFGWKLKNSGWGFGTFNLALTFPEVLEEDGWDATLIYLPGGTIVSLR